MINDHTTKAEAGIADATPHSNSSLVPMLIVGLVLTIVGMLIALAIS